MSDYRPSPQELPGAQEDRGLEGKSGDLELKEFIPGLLNGDRKGSLCRKASNTVGVSTGLSVPESGSRFYCQSHLARSNKGPSDTANNTRPTGSSGHATADLRRW